MKSVKEFKLSLEPVQKVNIPNGSEILSLQNVGGFPSLFVLADSAFESPRLDFRTAHIYATGKEVPQNLNVTYYRGSFEFKAEVGQSWLHVFVI